MMKSHKYNILNSYGFGVVVFIVFYVLLTFGCSAQKELQDDPQTAPLTVAFNAVNINTATVEELEKIRYIGPKLARQIVDYRETHGSFRKPEHLMMIQGISDKRFRQIRALIKTE